MRYLSCDEYLGVKTMWCCNRANGTPVGSPTIDMKRNVGRAIEE